MYTSLLDAPVNTGLTVVRITTLELGQWLNHLGIYSGSVLMRHGDEFNFHPVRIRAAAGDVVVPAGMAIKAVVHVQSGERKPLTEMEKNDNGHLETIAGGRGCVNALKKLGLEIDSEITFIRALPHMDYVILVDQQQRTRLSEGEAARIWGLGKDGLSRQFYFARRGEEFKVTEILGGKKVSEHLATHGIAEGHTLLLERIEQAQQAHTPNERSVTVSSLSGLRLYLSHRQAEQIIVTCSDEEGPEKAKAFPG